MRSTIRGLALWLAVGGLAACDDGPTVPGDLGPAPDADADGAPGPEPDAAPDPEPDMRPGPEPDGGPEADLAIDAAPDIGPTCEDGQTRACDVEGPDGALCAGVATCVDGTFGSCAPPAEICDGADTDCNGIVDDVEGAGAPCTAGQGACARDGVTACVDGALACDATPGEAGEEICANGVDDDCSGEVDEAPCLDICPDDDACGEGRLCIDGECVPGDCRADGECAAGALCIDNTCTEADCRIDGDCPPGEACIGLACAPRPAACVDPTVIDAPGSYAGSTQDAPSEVGASCGGGARSPERAFRVELGVEGPICVSTFGSGYDTALYVQARCGDPATELACNDDVLEGNVFSQIELPSGAEPVFVFVDGFGAISRGPFSLNVNPGPCPCLADEMCPETQACRAGDCVDVVCGDGVVERGEGCDDGGIEPGDGCDAACAVEGGFVCEPDPITGRSRCRPVVCVDDDDCFDDDRCRDGACGPPGEICDDGVDDDGDGAVDCLDPDCEGDPACAPADACAAPAPIVGPGIYEGDTAGGFATFTEADPDCVDSPIAADSAEAVFALTPAADGDLCLSTLGSTFDTVLYVRADACDDPAAEVACNDDADAIAGGNRAALTLAVSAGRTWFVFVDGFGAANDGPFVLRVLDGPCAPPVEVCDNGRNDDFDPRVDCDDPDCFRSEICLALNCGDGAPGPGEACDDGGREPGDGCDAACLVEVGYRCERPDPDGPSVCRSLAVCGDGALDPSEQCDDGGVEDGDGCDAGCTLEIFEALRAVQSFDAGFAAGRSDAVHFTVDHDPSRLRAATGGPAGCPGDTRLTVHPLDAEGARGPAVATDDDGGEGGCSAIDAVLAPGRYALVADAHGAALDAVRIDYRLEVDITPGGAYAGAAAEGGSDLYVFDLDGPASAALRADDGAAGCPSDTRMRLFSVDAFGDWTPIAADGEGGGCARLLLDLAPGRYAVEVDAPDGGAIPAYTLTADLVRPVCGNGAIELGETCDDGGVADGDGCDAACTAEEFVALRAVERFPIDFAANGDDVVRFTVDHAPSRLVAELSDGAGGCPGDTVLDLYPLDAEGARGPLQETADGGGVGDCSRLDTELDPGPYALVARGFNGAPLRGLALDHRLTVAIDGGGAFDGATPIGGDDLYTFTLAAAAPVALSTSDGADGCPGDTRLTLFGVDAEGARVAVAADDGQAPCAGLAVDLEPGAYEVEASGRDAALDAYVLEVRVGPPPFDVAIRDFTMEPDPLVIPVGRAVRWTNLGAVAHTVTSGAPGSPLAGAIFDSGDLAPGARFAFTFLSPGEYTYFCRPHSDVMQGFRVIVEAEEDPDRAICEESCDDGVRCFDLQPDPDCVDGCLSSPDTRAVGRCVAEELDPDTGACDFGVYDRCNDA